jgi:diguanylate cyclase (GGDEF)-like protein
VTLRARLTTVLVAVVVIPLVIGTILLAGALPGAFSEQQGRAVSVAARLGGDVVAGLCDRARAAAEAAGRGVLSVPADELVQQRQVLRSLVERGLADALQVTDATGRVVAVGEVPEGSSDCGDAEPAGDAVAAAVLLEQPGETGSAQAVAVLAAGEELAGRLQAEAGGDVVLLADGQVVAATAPPPPALLARALAGPGEPVTEDGSIATLAPARPGQPLGVLVVQPVTRGVDLVRAAVAIVLGAALLAAGLALWLARTTVRPLEELGDAAARVASGDLSTTIDVRSQDEVGQLARAFNTMTDELRGYVGALEASRDELRAGLARLGQTLTGTHDLDRIVAVVLETALASTTARSGAVLLREAGGDGLVLAAGRGLPTGAAGSGLRFREGEGAIGQAAVDGLARRTRVADDDRSPLDPGAHWVLAVPLCGSDTVLGVLVLYDPRSHGAGDEDLITLRTLAGQAAVAVENVLRHRNVSRMAVTDALTGLANYRSFTDTIGREVERATRFHRPVGLVLLDIDHFKHVNDTLGHQRGDAVLVELAERVQGEVRDIDTVARYGGEELVVVLPETDVPGAEQAAERIRVAIAARPFGELPDVPVHVTVSLGVAVHGVHATTSAGLLRRADEALYAAKGAGRDTWRTASA